METLVEKAYKMATQERQYSDQEIELAKAYLHGKINLMDVCRVLSAESKKKHHATAAYSFVCRAIRSYYKNKQP